ncbi:MAG: hypothetical protein AWT59_0876 [Candidatus Gallionella acididurans]|jgi:hypothetical protein|uniref:Uncharacterized protein n=1 Tax=Candidatus Gallionella acididurans TaxID=1796491 RepID=A0A139BVU9_9PROT|nr:MAG: hypothetical protein AWT59_0876 [Candidatus Gallionella acididurans]
MGIAGAGHAREHSFAGMARSYIRTLFINLSSALFFLITSLANIY